MSGSLATKPSRQPTAQNVDSVASRGRSLWDSIYSPFEDKLYDKLALAHPDLPVVILNSHYGPLLSDPPGERALANTGRTLTSMVAVACLRCQTGVGPQVLSHVFGLRKGLEDGTYKGDEMSKDEVEWLASDEGIEWILKTVDGVAEALGGSTFGKAAKL